jgi:subtilisin family serine protease
VSSNRWPTFTLPSRHDGRASTQRRLRITSSALGLAIVASAIGVSPIAAAAAPSFSSLGDHPERLDSLGELQALADTSPAPNATATIGVVIDRNGGAPGGISVERISVAPADARAVIEQLDTIAEVVTAAPEQLAHGFDDPLAGEQWSNAATRRVQADTTADGAGIIVAVVDSGVAASHEDLAGSVLAGASFLTGDAADRQPGTVDPNGHGTHVAGIIAARANGIGVQGVSSGVTILPVRVLRANGAGFSSDIAAGILWAHQQGADIINVSLGNQGPMPADVGSVIESVTHDTSRGKAPSIVVAASGNYGSTVPVWPASSPSVITVGAANLDGNIASFTSTGPALDVVAPGVSIASTCSDGGYCLMSGTSMATPYVTGTMALARQLDPSLTVDSALARIATTSRDVLSPGRDDASGAGVLDVPALLAVGAVAKVPAPPRLTDPSCDSSRCALTVGAPLVDGGSALTDVTVELIRNGEVVASQPITNPVRVQFGGLAPGATYSWQLVATNAVGRSTPRVLRVAAANSDGSPGVLEPGPVGPPPAAPPAAAPAPPAPPVSAAAAPKKAKAKPKPKPKKKVKKAIAHSLG